MLALIILKWVYARSLSTCDYPYFTLHLFPLSLSVLPFLLSTPFYKTRYPFTHILLSPHPACFPFLPTPPFTSIHPYSAPFPTFHAVLIHHPCPPLPAPPPSSLAVLSPRPSTPSSDAFKSSRWRPPPYLPHVATSTSFSPVLIQAL